jgi:hypothetical protein
MAGAESSAAGSSARTVTGGIGAAAGSAGISVEGASSEAGDPVVEPAGAGGVGVKSGSTGTSWRR